MCLIAGLDYGMERWNEKMGECTQLQLTRAAISSQRLYEQVWCCSQLLYPSVVLLPDHHQMLSYIAPFTLAL